MRNFFFLLLLFFTASCASNHLNIASKTARLGEKKGFETVIYKTDNFKIFALQKITDPQQPLRIYFEGDGKAFINRNIVSPNPTPTSYFLVNLLLQDDYANILYIARPCQYVDDEKCQEKYWTSARFSKEVLDSINDVVEKFTSFELELVGFSGGAEVAKYVILQNRNIRNFRTIAGNLDHKKFAEIHNVPSLSESFFADGRILPQLGNIPQIHFVGHEDKIIPFAVAESYVKKLPKRNCAKIYEVKGATHSKGWTEKWPALLHMVPFCEHGITKKMGGF